MATALASAAAAAAVIVALWGVAHAVPTAKVIAGFEPLTGDNRRILVQEWLAEAFTMWGLAAVILTVTVAAGASAHVSRCVYLVAAGVLVALATLTGLTGARTPVIWFKICTVVDMLSAGLLVVAVLV